MLGVTTNRYTLKQVRESHAQATGTRPATSLHASYLGTPYEEAAGMPRLPQKRTNVWRRPRAKRSKGAAVTGKTWRFLRAAF